MKLPPSALKRVELSLSAAVALATLGLAYRWLLAHALLASGIVEMRRWLGEARTPGRLALEAAGDLRLLVCTALLLALLPAGSSSRLLRRLALATTLVVVVAFGAVAAAHVRLLIETQSQLDLEMLTEAVSASSVDSLDFVGTREIALVALPPLLVLLLRWLPGRSGRWTRLALATTLLAGPSLFAAQTERLRPRPRPELREHPLLQLADELLTAPDLGLDALPALGEEQQRTLALVDPVFTGAPEGDPHPPPTRASPPGRRPDVLMVVLESTAFRDALGETPTPATPFLRRLAGEGWTMLDHHSTANSTPRAIFSLLTGLYPPPDASMFVTARDLALPALPALLPGYRSLLVTPIDTSGLFPRGLLLRNGLKDIVDRGSIAPDPAYPEPRAGRSEHLAFRALRERLAAPRDAPLFALYLTFAPHQPYYDQAAEHAGNVPAADIHQRYLSCLRLVDDELRTLVEELERTDRARETILVVVADHGEAFHQHGMQGHIRSTYEEILHVPAVLWAPGRLAPRAVTAPTSHVDLLPTLLDLTGVPFDPRAFQGVSLVDGPPPRRYVFAVGAERKLAAISSDSVKISWSFRDGTCRAFDLASDSAEKRPISCTRRPRQFDATRLFYRFQNRQLRRFESYLRHQRSGTPPPALSVLPAG